MPATRLQPTAKHRSVKNQVGRGAAAEGRQANREMA
jgi:hypothetical protein